MSAMDTETWMRDARASYNAVADGYAVQMRGALDDLPHLRAGLGLLAEAVHAAEPGPVADVGCGPGHVTAYLTGLGLRAFGIDLSPAMASIAGHEHPGMSFAAGSMTALPLADASIAGLVAFWSIIHVPDHALFGVYRQFRRVLRLGGPLLLGFHVGDGSRLKTEGYGGRPMKVQVYRRQPTEVAAGLREAGFEVEAYTVLDPDGKRPGALLFAR